MPRKAIRTGLAVIGVGIAVLITFIVGLFVYVNATARPLHPDPNAVPVATQPVPAATWATAVEQGRQVARGGLIAQNLPGLSVAVGVGGDVVWAEGLGFADLEKRVPVTPATRFRVADASIALTSAAVGLLVEQNKLNLDADIQRYVPEFPEKQWPVTLRQLMGHTAGIRNDEGDEEPLQEQCARTADGVQRFATAPLRFEPGTKYRYSSYGWILVSAAVETAAGEPFFTFMRSRIFEPLGMTSTRPEAWKEPIPDRATFYFPRFGGDTRYGPESAREGDQSCFAGAGAFLSTPGDLVRFGIAMSRGKLLQRATVEMLQTRQRLTSGEESERGLGWSLESVELGGQATRMAGHGSKQDFIGGTTYLMTFPERGIVVAIMTNTSFADAKTIALGIAQHFAQRATGPAAR